IRSTIARSSAPGEPGVERGQQHQVLSGYPTLRRGAQVFVTPTWTTVGDTGISAKNKEPGPGADPDASDELLIYVDRQTRWAELIELMRTAHAQGDTGFSLVAEHADDIQGLPVLPPPLWSHDGGHIFDREPPRPEVTFVIETDAVRVSELEGRILLTELDRL